MIVVLQAQIGTIFRVTVWNKMSYGGGYKELKGDLTFMTIIKQTPWKNYSPSYQGFANKTGSTVQAV